MGLDMYLKGRRWISYNENDTKTKIADAFSEVGDLEVQEIVVKAGYWRKANHIHKWFVDNVQGGQDDCGNYPVSREKLQELLDTCDRVLKFQHLAEAQLPTQEGFFFGSTDYGQYYYDDVEETMNIVKKVLAMPDAWEFEYHSSW